MSSARSIPESRRRRLRAAPAADRTETVDFSRVFAAALAGEPCHVAGMDGEERLLPMARWDADADTADDALLDLCEGTTLDVGCGPGRLTERLAERGHVVMGVDIVAEAVLRTRSRGVSAVRRDLFERLPGEGRWQTVLLADGNIGIGGDPVHLLRRMCELVAPGGRVIVETAPPGGGMRLHRARLRSGRLESRPFAWATVAADHVGELLDGLPLSLLRVDRVCDRGGDEAATSPSARWCATLHREGDDT